MLKFENVMAPLPCTSDKINCDGCQINLLGQDMRSAWFEKKKYFHCLDCASKIEAEIASRKVSALVAEGIQTAPDLLAALQVIADAIQAKPATSDKPKLFKPGEPASTDTDLHDLLKKLNARMNQVEFDSRNYQMQIDKLEKQLKDLQGA